jgi:hypothetical protein
MNYDWSLVFTIGVILLVVFMTLSPRPRRPKIRPIYGFSRFLQEDIPIVKDEALVNRIVTATGVYTVEGEIEYDFDDQREDPRPVTITFYQNEKPVRQINIDREHPLTITFVFTSMLNKDDEWSVKMDNPRQVRGLTVKAGSRLTCWYLCCPSTE